MTWNVQRLTPRFGARLSGGDLNGAEGAAPILDLLHEHRLLVVGGQDLTPAGHVALASTMGTPTPAHPVVPGLDGYPEVFVLDGALGGKNAQWHTDVTFVAAPPSASILRAVDLPPYGGDTMWADTRTAFEMLSAPIREAITELRAVHAITPLAYWGVPFDTALNREDAAKLLADSKSVPPVLHPVVRVHPVTGRPNLFVNPGFTSHVAGLARHESDHLLALLYAHMTQPEFTIRHRWSPGDVVLWDNKATMHYAVDDYADAHRVMHRVTIRGEAPSGPTGFVSHIADDPMITMR